MSTSTNPKRVVIIGGGFAGLNAAKKLGNVPGIRVTLIDRRNHHLFQPLLYQVAMAALSPADIAAPIRSILSNAENTDVLLGNVLSVDVENKKVHADFGDLEYDYLVMACGASHSYFGNDHWEEFAPGLKSLEEALEIRRRVLKAFERAEREEDPEKQKELLNFVVVGGGPTGVELAGALGEIRRFALAKDFHHIDPKRTRVTLVEGGERILLAMDPRLSEEAQNELENLGVTVWTNCLVTEINDDGVRIGGDYLRAKTVLWAAGVKPSELNQGLGVELGRGGRVIVEPDLSVKGHPEVFVLGDQANFSHELDAPLPGLAPVAIQMGKLAARNIARDLKERERINFKYIDKGSMATIGRGSAVLQTGKLRMSGFLAWLGWLLVHVSYLIGFKNRLIVMIYWAWSYVTLRRGARLITDQEWRIGTKQRNSIRKAADRVAKKAGKKKAAKKAAKKAKKKAAKK